MVSKYHYTLNMATEYHDETLDELYYVGIDDIDWIIFGKACSLRGANVLINFDNFSRVRDVTGWGLKIDKAARNASANVYVSLGNQEYRYEAFMQDMENMLSFTSILGGLLGAE